MKVGYSMPPVFESRGGIDHRQRVVRILAVPQAEIFKPVEGGAEIAVREATVIGLEQERHRRRRAGQPGRREG